LSGNAKQSESKFNHKENQEKEINRQKVSQEREDPIDNKNEAKQ